MADRSRYRGILLDFGGVITTDMFASIAAHCRRLGLSDNTFRDLVTKDPAGSRLYHQLERGDVTQGEFEAGIADLLGVAPDGLVRGLLAGLEPDEAILGAAQRARAAGVRVGLLSNSWGLEPFDPYEPFHLRELLDCLVISEEVGIRKPDPGIYEIAADRLGVPPSACVFVDDLAHNLPPAEALGMAVILHTNSDQTVAKLERLLRMPLAV